MHVSLAYRNLKHVPSQVNKKDCTSLDLSSNVMTSLVSLKGFLKLETLVLDKNKITSHTQFPFLPNLKSLWVNKNKIDNLVIFMDKVGHRRFCFRLDMSMSFVYQFKNIKFKLLSSLIACLLLCLFYHAVYSNLEIQIVFQFGLAMYLISFAQ